jgi:acyl-coenzyme A thioesterase PaaI-like protein
MSDIVLDDDKRCFACGPNNPIGLKLTFEEAPGERTRTMWRPKREHEGFKGIVHGGLIATVLDEVMIRMLYGRGVRAVTGTLEARMIQPLRSGREYRFEAWLVKDRGRAVLTEGEGFDAETGERVAWGRATCIRVG